MRIIRISLAIILSVYSIPAILSASDIYKGSEPDLSSEWIVLSIYIILSLAFALVSILELLKEKSAKTNINICDDLG